MIAVDYIFGEGLYLVLATTQQACTLLQYCIHAHIFAMAFIEIIGSLALALLAWTLVKSIQRLYFHPLAHIPGPKAAALTWWYEFYFDVIQPAQYIFKIQELHKQYGESSIFILPGRHVQ